VSTGRKYIEFTRWIRQLGFDVDNFPGAFWDKVLHEIEDKPTGKNIVKTTLHDIEEYTATHKDGNE
jgi:hypothetical protein